jgi:hypothetical protein
MDRSRVATGRTEIARHRTEDVGGGDETVYATASGRAFVVDGDIPRVSLIGCAAAADTPGTGERRVGAGVQGNGVFGRGGALGRGVGDGDRVRLPDECRGPEGDGAARVVARLDVVPAGATGGRESAADDDADATPVCQRERDAGDANAAVPLDDRVTAPPTVVLARNPRGNALIEFTSASSCALVTTVWLVNRRSEEGSPVDLLSGGWWETRGPDGNLRRDHPRLISLAVDVQVQPALPAALQMAR